MEEEPGKQEWRWTGHSLRKQPGRTRRQALQWKPQGARKRDRPGETERQRSDRKDIV